MKKLIAACLMLVVATAIASAPSTEKSGLSAGDVNAPVEATLNLDLFNPDAASFFTGERLTVAQGCCKVCHAGKACGDSCISRDKQCHQPPGCACDG